MEIHGKRVAQRMLWSEFRRFYSTESLAFPTRANIGKTALPALEIIGNDWKADDALRRRSTDDRWIPIILDNATTINFWLGRECIDGWTNQGLRWNQSARYMTTLQCTLQFMRHAQKCITGAQTFSISKSTNFMYFFLSFMPIFLCLSLTHGKSSDSQEKEGAQQNLDHSLDRHAEELTKPHSWRLIVDGK